jgi:hypothetical protein
VEADVDQHRIRGEDAVQRLAPYPQGARSGAAPVVGEAVADGQALEANVN